VIILDTNAISAAMIAAIARVHRATVATRNVSDFKRCGIHLIDPWPG